MTMNDLGRQHYVVNQFPHLFTQEELAKRQVSYHEGTSLFALVHRQRFRFRPELTLLDDSNRPPWVSPSESSKSSLTT
jgi:hypothetical protein